MPGEDVEPPDGPWLTYLRLLQEWGEKFLGFAKEVEGTEELDGGLHVYCPATLVIQRFLRGHEHSALSRKALEQVLAQAAGGEGEEERTELARQLSARDLMSLGIAAIIGAGVFSTIGIASLKAGPASCCCLCSRPLPARAPPSPMPSSRRWCRWPVALTPILMWRLERLSPGSSGGR